MSKTVLPEGLRDNGVTPASLLSTADATLTRAQRKVLDVLFRYRNGDNQAFISTRALVRLTGIPRTTAQRAIEQLNRMGVIHTHPGNSLQPDAHLLLAAAEMIHAREAGRA